MISAVRDLIDDEQITLVHAHSRHTVSEFQKIYRTARKLSFTGPAVLPAANEAGWKDTVRADPGMVTRIIARFEGYTGRYVWHCHILEHEDNGMMSKIQVVAD